MEFKVKFTSANGKQTETRVRTQNSLIAITRAAFKIFQGNPDYQGYSITTHNDQYVVTAIDSSGSVEYHVMVEPAARRAYKPRAKAPTVATA